MLETMLGKDEVTMKLPIVTHGPCFSILNAVRIPEAWRSSTVLRHICMTCAEHVFSLTSPFLTLSLVNVYVIDTHLRTFHAEMYLKDFGVHFVDHSDHFALQNRNQNVCWLDVRCRESFGRLGRRAETAGHGLQNLQTCKREWMEQAQQYPILISALSIVLDY